MNLFLIRYMNGSRQESKNVDICRIRPRDLVGHELERVEIERDTQAVEGFG